jgi:hypothetical protein
MNPINELESKIDRIRGEISSYKLIGNSKLMIKRLKKELVELRKQLAKRKTARARESKNLGVELKPFESYADKTYTKRIKQRKAKDLNQITHDIKEFQDSNRYELEVDINGDQKKLTKVLKAIKIRKGFNTLLIVSYSNGDSVYRPLTKDTLSRIINLSMTVIDENTDITVSDAVFTAGEHFIQDIIIRQIDVEKFRKERLKAKMAKLRNRKGGGFFTYLNESGLDLTRYGIFNKVDAKDYELNCLQLAVKNSGLFTKEVIKTIGLYITDRHISLNKLPKIAEVLNCKITLHQLYKGNPKVKHFGSGNIVLNLGCIEEHFLVNEPTKYTMFSIKHIDEIQSYKDWHAISKVNGTSYVRRAGTKKIDSFTLVRLLLEQNKFKPMTLSTKNIEKTQYYADVNQTLDTLEYPKNSVRQCKNEKTTSETQKKIYYADFETCTEGSQHIAYMCCVVSGQTNKTFNGPNCGAELLEYLEGNSICYFHNLGYDFSFIIKFLNTNSLIKTGTQIKTVSGIYKGKKLTFKDSLAMIQTPLKSFTNMFKIQAKKEIMPYLAYTIDNVSRCEIPLTEALIHIKDNERQEFENAAEPYIFESPEKVKYFNLIDYAEFYCIQDCRTLQQGFETFREWIQTAFSIDVVDFISLPSLADQYLRNQGVYDDVYELSGIPRTFIQRCVIGGRCMTRRNEKHSLNHVINDFDAVSLYPSAMARIGFLKGKPKVLKQDQLNMEFLNTVDGYFVEIDSIVCNKHLDFPLQSNVVNGIRRFTNEFQGSIYVDKVSLEDFINYQEATFRIIRGYYYDDGRNDKIQETIKYCFSERLKQKAMKNPIEVVYKLLMNASYGKTIQKPIKSVQKFTNSAKQHTNFLMHNFNYIKDYSAVAKDKYVYNVQKSIEIHFSRPQIGVEILSMSKRIMNEVMCLAEDNDINIWYQDTDSMHIDDNQISALAGLFKVKYQRELIGKHMGQFHSDFIKDSKAHESIFLGKKSYIDVLVDAEGNKYDHIRMKGIPNSSILKHTSNLSPIDIYKKLYLGKAITFNLLAGKVIFKRNKDFSTKTMTEFHRKVKFV